MSSGRRTDCLAYSGGREVCAAQVACAKISCVASFAVALVNTVIVREGR
jgi:hypothetical protein